MPPLRMPKRRELNERRLTKKQVQELVNSGAILNDRFTKAFEKTYANGELKRDLYYTLPGERILRVFAENDISLPGRGDIFSLEYMEKFALWYSRMKEDYAQKRGSSVQHWRYYSRHKQTLVKDVSLLVRSLAEWLDIPEAHLDKSYKSLDLVSAACSRSNLDEVFAHHYDQLVAYVGEVIRTRVNGQWAVNASHAGGDYPFISVGLEHVHYMPINAVWTTLKSIDPVDLRKAAADQVRLIAPKEKVHRYLLNKRSSRDT